MDINCECGRKNIKLRELLENLRIDGGDNIKMGIK